MKKAEMKQQLLENFSKEIDKLTAKQLKILLAKYYS
tara:strand:+ start:414 stop:521 length:108 start_codon:yes stop_codon:yes gene_type:complete